MASNGYTAEEFPSFGGGLNLRDKPDVVDPSQCIDALNVTFTEVGAVRQRDGYASFYALTLSPVTTVGLSPFYTTSGTRQLVVAATTSSGGSNFTYSAVNTSGTLVASSSLGLGTPPSHVAFARFAAPGSEYLYACAPSLPQQRWNGTAWATPGATVNGGAGPQVPPYGFSAMAVMGVSNRLVIGGFTVTDGAPNQGVGSTNPSTVYFSGDTVGISPERWLTSNFIQVAPGDGEAVQAIAAWNNLVFIFKETKFFVVYGESQDGTGNPIFNYRPVNSGVGALSVDAVTVAPDGVYFVDRTGVYRTTGQEPQLISDAIRPIFDASTAPYYTGGVINTSVWAATLRMTYFDHRVWIGFPSGSATTNDKTLVYDTRFDTWTLLDLPSQTLSSFRIGTAPELVFANTTAIYRHSPSYTNDNGSAITSRWRSGWQDYGLTDDKTIRESKLWGSGKASLAISKDFDTSAGTANLVDMTPSSALLKGKLSRTAIRGTVFSTSLSNSTLNQAWELHRLAHHLREQRIQSVVTA